MAQGTDLGEYAARLRTYTNEELEDIYFNIHILRHPLRYRLVTMEMERRKLIAGENDAVRQVPSLVQWINRSELFRQTPALQAAVLIPIFLVVAAAVTFALYSPVWLFAVPLRFRGFQTAIAYVAWAPVPPIMGAAIAGKMGGRGLYSIASLAGAAAGIYLFNLTGAPSVIIASVGQPSGPGGGVFSGF